MDNTTIIEVLKILKKKYQRWKKPIITEIAEKKGSPFKILVSTVLSSRTRDEVTKKSSRKLFKKISTPEDLLKMNIEKIEKTIYPVGFYRVKAKRLKELSEILLDKHEGKVPDTIEELLELPGVGRKTANLVITMAFGKPGICVDTHVHRISNRFGYVNTQNPEETEFELRKKLPEKWWIVYNDLLVTLGQNICLPRKPQCKKCPVEKYCEKIGVKKK